MRNKHGAFGAKEEESSIDLTPMLDVVFIMLIFFIVTASFIKEAGIDVAGDGAALLDGELAADAHVALDVALHAQIAVAPDAAAHARATPQDGLAGIALLTQLTGLAS
jgi:biopolymer transport protein ExbD